MNDYEWRISGVAKSDCETALIARFGSSSFCNRSDAPLYANYAMPECLGGGTQSDGFVYRSLSSTAVSARYRSSTARGSVETTRISYKFPPPLRVDDSTAVAQTGEGKCSNEARRNRCFLAVTLLSR